LDHNEDETKILVSNVWTNEPGVGGVMVYAVKKDATGVKEHRAKRLFAGNIMTLSSGFWDFFAVMYQNTTSTSNGTTFSGAMTGDIRCAHQGLELNGGLKTVYFDFSKTTCNQVFFGSSPFRIEATGQYFKMKFEVCSAAEFATTTSYVSNCTHSTPYYARLMLPDFTYDFMQNTGKVISTGTGLFSQCFPHANSTILTQLPYKIPSGSDPQLSPAFLMMLYDNGDTACSNLKQRVIFPGGYTVAPSLGQAKVFTDTSVQTVKIFVLKNF
jgi:hypothetical protein